MELMGLCPFRFEPSVERMANESTASIWTLKVPLATADVTLPTLAA